MASVQSGFFSLAADRVSAAAAFPTSPRKTRVGGSRCRASGRLSRRARRRSMFTPGSRACAYKTASGRHEWLNRDPIGELGGLNLYGYVGNNPISFVDPNGLWKWYGNWGGPNWTGGNVGTWEDLVDNGITPKPPYPGQDECYEAHDKCHAACRDDFRGQCPEKWKSAKMALGGCLRDCDRALSRCLKKLGDDPSNDWHAHVGSLGFWFLGNFGHTFESDPPPRHPHAN